MQRDPSTLLSPALVDDPWSLDLATRRALRDEMPQAQQAWLQRLRHLVEPPAPDASFPGFLLETPCFAGLRTAIGDARRAHELDTATADQLQRFVDLYRDYLDCCHPQQSAQL